jgi:hypothetical protein
MPFEVTVERNQQYVRYNVAGVTSLKRFAGLVMLIATDVDHHEGDRVMVDLRKVGGRLTTSEQQLLGELVATQLAMIFKLASIVPEGEISRNSERSAINAGLLVRVFDSEHAAFSWLLEDNPS